MKRITLLLIAALAIQLYASAQKVRVAAAANLRYVLEDIKKQYEKLEKRIEEDKNLFHFMIRANADDRLLGKAWIEWIEWANGNGRICLGIGASEDRRKGYGTQALRMLLRFAFAELNLFRVTAFVPEYNDGAMALLQKFGFVQEVCRRKSLERDGRRWDLVLDIDVQGGSQIKAAWPREMFRAPRKGEMCDAGDPSARLELNT